MEQFIITLQSKKTGREVHFLIRYFDNATTTFRQIGDLKSGVVYKKFVDKHELVKSLTKYLLNESVFVRDVEYPNGLMFNQWTPTQMSRENMYLLSRDFIGDNAAIQLVNVIDRDKNLFNN